MAVPDTNTFSLSDVITELGLADDEGLQECFDDAVDSEFDTLYKGSKDSCYLILETTELVLCGDLFLQRHSQVFLEARARKPARYLNLIRCITLELILTILQVEIQYHQRMGLRQMLELGGGLQIFNTGLMSRLE